MSDVNPRKRRRDGLRAVETPTPPHAQSLLHLAGQGDEQAFASLYDEVVAMVYGVIRKVVRDEAISEEVTQEVFVEIWRTCPRYESSKGSAHAWIATIAHRRAVDRVRSEQSRRNREQADQDGKLLVSPEASNDLIDQLDQKRVRDALSVLSEPQRQAIELAYYSGRTYREVAVLLATPEGTIKTRIRDGLIRLRDHLEVTS